VSKDDVGIRLSLRGRRETARGLQATTKDVDRLGDELADTDRQADAAARSIRRATVIGERFGRVIGRGIGAPLGLLRRGIGGMVSQMTSLTGLLAGGGLILGGRRLLGLSIELEAMGNKAQVVFGDQLATVQQWADTSANRMGLTSREAVGLAAGFADLLIPMGFARDAASKLSTDVIGLSGALAQWSGGTRSAAEVSQILSAAMLGERESLKSLGIAISENDVTSRLAAKGQDKLTGKALEQAEAIATAELIFEKSTDAQAAYLQGTNRLGLTVGRTGAKLRELRDRAILALGPHVERLAIRTEQLVDEFDRGQGVGGRVRDRLRELRDQAVVLWEEFRTGTGTGGELRGAMEGIGAAAVVVGTFAKDYIVPAMSWLNDHPDALKGIVAGMVAFKLAMPAIGAMKLLKSLFGMGGGAGATAAAASATAAGGRRNGPPVVPVPLGQRAGAALGRAWQWTKNGVGRLGLATFAAGSSGAVYDLSDAGALERMGYDPAEARRVAAENRRRQEQRSAPRRSQVPVAGPTSMPRVLPPGALAGPDTFGGYNPLQAPPITLNNNLFLDGKPVLSSVVHHATRRRDLE
jgi:hypothetical protein